MINKRIQNVNYTFLNFYNEGKFNDERLALLLIGNSLAQVKLGDLDYYSKNDVQKITKDIATTYKSIIGNNTYNDTTMFQKISHLNVLGYQSNSF